MAIFRRKRSTDLPTASVERLVDVLGEWEYDPYTEEPPGALYWLQAWYAVNCNDEWEHGFGVSIETLDNPGWTVKIDVRDTALAGRPFDPINIERGDHDWLQITADGRVFQAACGPLNLGEVLDQFRKWAQ